MRDEGGWFWVLRVTREANLKGGSLHVEVHGRALERLAEAVARGCRRGSL